MSFSRDLCAFKCKSEDHRKEQREENVSIFKTKLLNLNIFIHTYMFVSVGSFFFKTLGRAEDAPLNYFPPNLSQITCPDMSAHG